MEKNTETKNITQAPWFKSTIGIASIILILGVFVYWRANAHQVYIENASIDTPIINLAPTIAGVLSDIYVRVGDVVIPSTPVAKVGDEIILSKVSGIITDVRHQEGQVFTVGNPVVSMINTDQERVVGRIDENKGFSDIRVGQPVLFTVDAFGSKKFEGIVDEVSPTSNQSGVVFSISDKREIKQFNIKARFNTELYSQIKNGMSAKMTVYTQ